MILKIRKSLINSKIWRLVRMKKILGLALVFVFFLGILGACGSSEDDIVGTWRNLVGTELVFNEDGTGIENFGDMDFDFEWSIDGDVLFVDFGFMAEEWEFSIDGDTLTIIDDIGQRNFGRVD